MNDRAAPAGDVPHGTLNGYNKYFCHCEECRRVWREYHREYRRRRKMATGETILHGRFVT
jgi:hypothetical protein